MSRRRRKGLGGSRLAPHRVARSGGPLRGGGPRSRGGVGRCCSRRRRLPPHSRRTRRSLLRALVLGSSSGRPLTAPSASQAWPTAGTHLTGDASREAGASRGTASRTCGREARRPFLPPAASGVESTLRSRCSSLAKQAGWRARFQRLCACRVGASDSSCLRGCADRRLMWGSIGFSSR